MFLIKNLTITVPRVCGNTKTTFSFAFSQKTIKFQEFSRSKEKNRDFMESSSALNRREILKL